MSTSPKYFLHFQLSIGILIAFLFFLTCVSHLTHFILIPFFTEIIFGDEYKKAQYTLERKCIPPAIQTYYLNPINSKYQTGLLLHIIKGCGNLSQSQS
jgi:hypothetical protein